MLVVLSNRKDTAGVSVAAAVAELPLAQRTAAKTMGKIQEKWYIVYQMVVSLHEERKSIKPWRKKDRKL